MIDTILISIFFAKKVFFSLGSDLLRVEKGISMTMIDCDITHVELLVKLLGFNNLATTCGTQW